ncbi:DUF4304 domain-containing protein [Hydrogenophaga sp.]|uniref:DUF4304 domain-containing protein n=1 Tax=Hydrogenophaga sp. TaxID=1904254 RepID=UPI00260AD2D5|nr:DUF4304 domain-containing protein [Hydrogenophaga sp.]MDM7948799.1 DUF4304 domain-containing protein [Hydrogenophaga sp.]
MGNTTELRREIKRVFVPFAEVRGFNLDQRHSPQFFEFRRIIDGELHLFDIQWEKYGKPRFVVNFGKSPAEGVEFNGEMLSPDQVSPAHCSVKGRLQPGKGRMTSSWFRQDKPLFVRLLSRESLYPPGQVVGQLIALFPELEAYWRGSGNTGSHLRLFQLPLSEKRNAV